VISSAVGWRHWLRGDRGRALQVAPADFRSLAWTLPAGLGASAAYGAMLHYWTDAYAPFLDSAVLVLSVIAQLLLMGRRIENWLFWLAVNTVAVDTAVGCSTRSLHQLTVPYGSFTYFKNTNDRQ
jgi:nicotinamide mononucleotide transporter